jgi:hypothetical protein
MTDILPALELVEAAMKDEKTSDEMAADFGVSVSTIHRRIDVARGLGIDIAFRRKTVQIPTALVPVGDPTIKHTYLARVRNRAEVEPQVIRWLDVLRNQDATQAAAAEGFVATRSDTGEKVIILATTQPEAEAWAAANLEPLPQWNLNPA